MTKRELGKKALAALQARERGKQAYAEADALLDEIADEGWTEAGEEIAMFEEDGKPAGKAKLVDQFAKKKKVWKPCGIRRYELERVG